MSKAPFPLAILAAVSSLYGQPDASAYPYHQDFVLTEKAESLRVSGEDLAWQVENRHLIVDFSKNPGTGRSGQINRIFVKRPGIWLSRERDQSTLHLSPNAAGREHYLPVNRWDPPENWTADARPLSFRLERSGPMPRLPELRARVVYEIYADSPLIRVEEEVEVRQTVDLTLLRMGEFTFAPDPRTPFTNLAWGMGGQAFEAGRNEKPELPVDVEWLGFIHRPANYGFISILTSLETSSPAGGPALLLNPGARFSGDPAHYFWRALITNNSGERGPAITIPAGSRYRLNYWLYWLEPGSKDPLKALSDVCKAVKRVGLVPFGVRRQREPDALPGLLATPLWLPAKRRDQQDSGAAASCQSFRSAESQSGVAGSPGNASGSLCRRTPKGLAEALRALQWLGRDFSYLFPGEDGASLRAAVHELELAGNQAPSPDLTRLLDKAKTVLKRHKLITRMRLPAPDKHLVQQTLSLNLGCGPSPVLLEIISSGRNSQFASQYVTLEPSRNQTEEIRLEPADTTWLVLKVSGRPEGGETKRLMLRIGDQAGELNLRSIETPLSSVQISFHDLKTGEKTPVAVGLHAEAGRLVVPPGALDFGKLGFLYEEARPVHYADWSSARVRSLDPHFGSSLFRTRPVPESACFYVDGELTTRLPPGTYRLTATRGLEYKSSSLVMNIESGQPFHATVNLERWTDMADFGWYSGDGHVHAERATPEINALIATWAAAEDVAFCNVLRMGDEERTYYEQYAYGPKGRYLGRGKALAPGQEDPRTTELGHTLHLNLLAPVRFSDCYADYEAVFSSARRGGAVSGLAHVGRQHWSFHAERGLTLLAPLGLVDFVEIGQMGYIGVGRWFDFLNLGFRLTAMAGSDVPWGGTLGNTRVYAYTGQTLSPDTWLAALRNGRTFVTTGPMLDFTVNAEPPGSLLSVRRGQKVTVSARAWGWGPHQPETVEIIVSGEALNLAKRQAGRESVTAELEFAAGHSVWVTALAKTAGDELTGYPGFFQGAIATPVYIEVEGEPWINKTLASKLVEERLNDLAAIEKWLGEDRPKSLRKTIEQARRYYRAIRR